MVRGSRLEKEPVCTGGGGNRKWLGGDSWGGTMWEEAQRLALRGAGGDRAGCPPSPGQVCPWTVLSMEFRREMSLCYLSAQIFLFIHS